MVYPASDVGPKMFVLELLVGLALVGCGIVYFYQRNQNLEMKEKHRSDEYQQIHFEKEAFSCLVTGSIIMSVGFGILALAATHPIYWYYKRNKPQIHVA